MIIDGLIQYLVCQASVTSVTGERIRFGNALSDALPHIVVNRLSTEPNIALDGTTDLEFTDMDIDCKAETPGASTALADTVKGLIDDYTGAWGDQTVGAVLLTNQSDTIEPKSDGSEELVFVTTLDFTVQHRTT